MRPSDTARACCLLAWALAACSGASPGASGALASGEGSGEAGGAERAVVVFEASLRAGPDAGTALGLLRPGTVVRVGEARSGWRWLETEGDLRVSGWVRAERLGCRALEPLRLETEPGAAVEARLAPGTLLAVRSRDRDALEVETVDPVALRGRIPARACGVGEPFVPRLPRDGSLRVLGRQAPLLPSSGSGGPIATLPAGHRFVVLGAEGRGQVPGRTDGAVVVEGRVAADALDPDPRSTPLDRLAEPLGYTHEAVVDASLRVEPAGSELALLVGGTPLSLLEARGPWSRVRTVGPIELEGWLESVDVRRVSLDHNELDPGARRRAHGPVSRDLPRTAEDEDQ